MLSTGLRGGKAFAAEQKLRELKKLLLKSKILEKRNNKKVIPNKSVKKELLT